MKTLSEISSSSGEINSSELLLAIQEENVGKDMTIVHDVKLQGKCAFEVACPKEVISVCILAA
jgi:hypothetical protein